MWQVWTSLLLAIAVDTTASQSQGIDVRAPEFSARIRNGSVVELKAADGTAYVRTASDPRGATIHREETGYATVASEPDTELTPGQPAAASYGEFSDLPGARLDARYAIDASTGELVIEQQATGAAAGTWGVGCWLDEIPLDYAILVPGGSGLRLTRDTPGPTFQYDYPMTWEVQLVVIEGAAGGCVAWAEDRLGRYKRLVVERRATGWRIGLITINDAPFDSLTACESVRWRVSTYTGDWRVPARRYRDWWEAVGHPVPIAQQQPAWVRDMRGCVVAGLDLPILERLPAQFDPAQTMLYVYNWRTAGYDRDYPDYARMRPELLPYIARAHALGFRVMLHVNYFGVDPLHPAYAQFERYQVRSPWGTTRPVVPGATSSRKPWSSCVGRRAQMPCIWIRHSASITITTAGSTACRCLRETSRCIGSSVRRYRRWPSAARGSTRLPAVTRPLRSGMCGGSTTPRARLTGVGCRRRTRSAPTFSDRSP